MGKHLACSGVPARASALCCALVSCVAASASKGLGALLPTWSAALTLRLLSQICSYQGQDCLMSMKRETLRTASRHAGLRGTHAHALLCLSNTGRGQGSSTLVKTRCM